MFSPAAVAVYRDRPHGSPRNCVYGHGSPRSRPLERRCGSAPPSRPTAPPGLAADITAEAVAELRLAVGERVWFTVKTQAVGCTQGAPGPHDAG